MTPEWKQKARTEGAASKAPELLHLPVGVVEALAVKGREDAIEFVMNGSNPDRGGDLVDHNGAELAAFLANPVMPWGHNYSSLPLGNWENVRVESGQLRGLGVFSAREIYPFAETVLQMYRRKILRACSIGFRPLQWAWNEARGPWAVDYMKYELLECSAVMIGQHQDALATLSLAKGEGLDIGPVLDEFERIVSAEGRGLFVPVDQAKRVLLALGPKFFDLAPAVKARAEVLELGDVSELVEKAPEPVEPAAPPTVRLSIAACGVCGGGHRDLEIRELGEVREGYSHWGLCPAKGDPVFLAISSGASPAAAAGGAGDPPEDDPATLKTLALVADALERFASRNRSAVQDGIRAVTGAFIFDDEP